MNTKEQQLLQATVGGDTVHMKVRSRTCIDVGLWWRGKPLWLAITDREVVLLAISRRKYIERVPVTACHGIHYSPAGGELVIPSSPALRFPRLRMRASTALEAIELVQALISGQAPQPAAQAIPESSPESSPSQEEAS